MRLRTFQITGSSTIQEHAQANNNENIMAPHYGPFSGESIGNPHKRSVIWWVMHLMSSC